MRAKKTALAAIALVAGLSLTACQGDEDPAASGNDSGSSSSSEDTAAETSGDDTASGEDAEAGGESSTAAGSDEGSGGGQITTGSCKTANLEFDTSHGMGEGTLMVSLKNTGDACYLKGFPGVDLKVDSGKDGISAERSELAAPVVNVKSGETTRFTLHYPRNDTGGSGTDITNIVVTPPNETHSKTLPVSINLPVTDSTVSNVTVDPVGTGKQ